MNRIVCITFLLMAAASLAAAPVDKDHLEKYGRGIIEDYSDMKEGEDIEWVWISPDVKLKEYKFKVKPFENMTVMADSDMEQVFEKTLPRTLDRVAGKGDSPRTLAVEGAIFWAERAKPAKRWIPYAGGHLAQAGLGIEMVFKNKKGEIIAKLRHTGREGDDFETAAQELVDDVAEFVKSH